ncbi:prenyltransferase/squalene oxidase repeat-containing protein [Actinomadura macra]|uniref:prenyltransferase/squalene oxidase repeat-containing protein n=1 Tax=Actinomadura macra TaxID=46164 RepID=UPI0008378986|nr:prenyltransferase/squalene oxidase repeat-containing protein [Actinomadura macra]
MIGRDFRAESSTRHRAEALLGRLGTGGSFGPCPYTTAWLSRLRRDDGAVRFPRARRWLIGHQRSDGSWGGEVELPHDRTVCTLAAVVALTDPGPPLPGRMGAVRAGLGYLRAHSSAWRGAATGETIGFEMAVPLLLGQLSARGLDLPSGDWADLTKTRQAKLDLIPRDRLLGEPTSLMYSLETIEPDPALRALARFTAPDGSLANSPSATAALWTAGGGGRTLAYLEAVAELDPDGGVPALYPTEAFELAWVLHHLQRAGLLGAGTAAAGRCLGRLRTLLGQRGRMGLSGGFPLPDPDDSAMAIIVLDAAGHDVRHLLDGLLAFEGEHCFFTYPGERDGSVTPNARVLEALALRPDAYARPMRKVGEFLLETRREDAWWYDKWHVSPYYATAQVTFALTRATSVPLDRTLAWLLDTQRPDGSWGWYGRGTPEETGCAVLNLDALARHGMRVPASVWGRARRYLRDHLDGPFPELWVGRSLYTPYVVSSSTVLAGAELASAYAAVHADTRCALP